MIKSIMQRGIYAASFLIIAISTVNAQGYYTDWLPLQREDPNKPISNSRIITEVKNKFPGEVLSITPLKSEDSGEDCHRVNSMGDDNYFRIIMVACQ